MTTEQEIEARLQAVAKKAREFQAARAHSTGARAPVNESPILVSPDPEMDSWRAMQADKAREADHQKKVDDLRLGWNAPLRQVRTKPNLEGPFGDNLEMLTQRLGNNFTVALIGPRHNPGKTQLAVELMRAATANLKTALYVKAIHFFMEIQDTYGRDRKGGLEGQLQVLRRFSKPWLLVIDEIQERGDTNWEQRLLVTLIDDRYAATKDTLLVGNFTPEELQSSLGTSIMARCTRSGGVIQADWTVSKSP